MNLEKYRRHLAEVNPSGRLGFRRKEAAIAAGQRLDS
jgi:hypothetical protein